MAIMDFTPDREVTATYVRQILDYFPETGEFVWKDIIDSKGRRNRRSNLPAGTTDWNGYLLIGINNKRYKAHRIAWLIMTGSWPVNEIDHRDCNPSNNCWSNLREATKYENMANRGPNTNNKAGGYKGVFYKNAEGYNRRWVAQIMVNRRNIYIGSFYTKEEAGAAYAEAAEKYHKEFARIK